MENRIRFDFISPLLVLLGLSGLMWLIFWGDTDLALVSDWLGREGEYILAWWLLSSLMGLSVLPILFRLLPALPSRGYALARAAGVMLVGFVFWYVGSLGFWDNSTGAMVLAWLLVLAISAWVWSQGSRFDLRAWWREHWVLVVVVEITFLILLFGWAGYRAHEPEIRSTEKPMEMMFINSIRESPRFPPADGWLAGYSISYYYFGYVLTAMMADLSGANTGIAFGLVGAWLFALAGIGVLGLVYDLVSLRKVIGGRHSAVWAGILGLLLLIILGNLGPFFIELPWNGDGVIPARASYFEAWGVPERSRLALQVNAEEWRILADDTLLNTRPSGYTVVRDNNANLIPDFEESARPFTQWDFWWWFRYSRVVEDDFLNGQPIGVQPIAEFPHFSFILADIHPHVLALPFALLALTLAAGLALRPDPLPAWGYPLLAIWVGGMAFLNSWDAVFIVFLVGAEALRRVLLRGRMEWLGVMGFGVIFALLSFLAYFPWIFSFTSQAGGFYLNIIWPTEPQQLFLQFGAFFLLLIPFVVSEWGGVDIPKLALRLLVLFILLVMVFPFFGAFLYHNLCAATDGASVCQARQILFGGVSPDTSDSFWGDLLARRAMAYPSHLLMLLLLLWISTRLFSGQKAKQALRPETGFALLVLAAALVLIILPDYIYLVDNFRVRINTVFKLYYQGWILLSVVSAYAVAVVIMKPPASSEKDEILHDSRFGPLLLVYGTAIVLVLVLLMGMVYPVYAARSRALDETGRYAARERGAELPLSLDGRPSSLPADEYAVISCLLDLPSRAGLVVAEAPFNGGYNITYGRVATLTGIPNLLGWINHQGQWRGPSFERVTEVVRDVNGFTVDSREMQADKLYRTSDWAEADAVIRRYGIDYVIIGQAEQERYKDSPDGLEKFANRYEPWCQAGNVALYAVGG